jgi:hypothetical protein
LPPFDLRAIGEHWAWYFKAIAHSGDGNYEVSHHFLLLAPRALCRHLKPVKIVFFGVTMVYYDHPMLKVASNEKAFLDSASYIARQRAGHERSKSVVSV